MHDTITITREEYDRLREAAEDLADLQAYDRARADLDAGRDELVPAEFANRILNGESPLRVYRDLRGLTQSKLAERAGVHRVAIAEIETGRKQGSITTIKKLAAALSISVDDLV